MVLLLLLALVAPVLLFHGTIVLRGRGLGPFPGPRPRLLALGSLLPLLRAGLLDYYRREAVRAGGDLVVWLGVVPHVVVARPESAVEVLADRDVYVREIAPTVHLFGGGMLRLEGETWRDRRQTFVPAFRRDAIEGAVAIVGEEAEALVAEWAARNEPFGPARDVSFRMLRILGCFLFGFSFDRAAHGGPSLHHALITLSTGSVARHLLPAPVVWLRGDRAERTARQRLDALGSAILREGADTPFLAALRAARASGTLSEQDALDEIRTFLVAGHETSATALTWTLALLAAHPEVQARVHAEVATAPRLRTAEDVATLTYTTQVLQEALRLYPPVPISISRTTRATTLGGRALPAGTRVDISSYVLHRDPTAWPDPDRFDPDRFAPGRVATPGTYLPFLLGPHTCLGMRFAMLEMPIVLAAIVRAYVVTAPVPPRVNLRLSLHPQGLRIALEGRAEAARSTGT